LSERSFTATRDPPWCIAEIRAISFSSSWTLPGKSYAASSRIASPVNPSIFFPALPAYSARKCDARHGMSCRLYLSGGTMIGMTFSR